MSNKVTIVLVEDSVTQAKKIAALVSEHDVNVIIAEDGRQGLRMVNTSQPALVVLDVNLPDMSGFQVCRRLKRDSSTAHIPVVILTTSSSRDEIEEGLQSGAYNYIVKNEHAADALIDTLHDLGLIGSAAFR